MNRYTCRTSIGAWALGLILVSGAARAGVSSHFDSDNEGWAIVSYPFRSASTGSAVTSPLTFDGSVGLPPGSVRVGDVYAETGIAAPAAFLGDRQAYYGGQLSYDIFLRFSDGVTYPAVVLVGATMSLYYDAPSPPVGAWEHRAVPLTETGWKIGGSQLPVAQADFAAVLQSLSDLYIYTEWHTGDDDTSVDNIVLDGGSTAAGDVAGARLAARCYPNPFNPRTTIRFELPEAGVARVAVHDVAGRLVRLLVDESLPAGSHEALWDGRDASGREVGSGTYLARLEWGARAEMVRMQLIR